MECPKCDGEVKDDFALCPSCGENLHQARLSAIVSPQPSGVGKKEDKKQPRINKIISITLIALLAGGFGGFIWRLFFVHHIGDITNLELYLMLSSDIKWIIAFQTGILAGLLLMILSGILPRWWNW